jgi:hypothetical protein
MAHSPGLTVGKVARAEAILALDVQMLEIVQALLK